MVLHGQVVGGLTVYYGVPPCVYTTRSPKKSQYMLVYFTYHSTPQWMVLHGQTVGGLTVHCVDAFTT